MSNMSRANYGGAGGRLRWVREQRAMTQTEMAKAFGVSLRSYQNYERGDSEFPVHLMSAAMRLGIHPHWLVTGQGMPFLDAKHTPIHLLPSTAAQASQEEPGDPQPFRPELMAMVIRVVLEAAQKRHSKVGAVALANACVALYEMSVASGTPPSGEAVARLLTVVR